MPQYIDPTFLTLIVLAPLIFGLIGTARVLYAVYRYHQPMRIMQESIDIKLVFLLLIVLTELSWIISFTKAELIPLLESPIIIPIVGLGALLLWDLFILFLLKRWIAKVA